LITTMLMDCIAATPRRAGRRSSARMTNAEKAKKVPAISPLPTAASTLRRL
jgi:hypothetical protein